MPSRRGDLALAVPVLGVESIHVRLRAGVALVSGGRDWPGVKASHRRTASGGRLPARRRRGDRVEVPCRAF